MFDQDKDRDQDEVQNHDAKDLGAVFVPLESFLGVQDGGLRSVQPED